MPSLKKLIKNYGKPVPVGINKADLKRGIKIEHEHTGNKKVATAIAVAHLKEFKNYYNPKYGLPALEKRLRKR